MFKFKGISSTEMQVIIEEEELFLAKASQRYEVTEIDGKDDAIFDELGYSYIERPIYIQCLNPDKLDDIFEWLDGEGELEYKGRKTKARFYTSLEPNRVAGIRIIDTNFIRAPFWEKAEDDYIDVTTNVTNEGNKTSNPIIRLEKNTTDTVELTVAETRFKYTFNENDTYVEIDCEEKTALYEGLNRNRNLIIGYDFPKFSPGINTITIHDGDAIIRMKRKDRWL